jgi:hypothetical protein
MVVRPLPVNEWAKEKEEERPANQKGKQRRIEQVHRRPGQLQEVQSEHDDQLAHKYEDCGCQQCEMRGPTSGFHCSLPLNSTLSVAVRIS